LAEYPLRIICDTSVYIPFINQGIAHPVFSDEPMSPVLYMSIVVLSELFAGAHDSQSIKLLNRLYHTFDSVGRLIVPDARDWQQTGSIISKMRTKYGFERQYLARIQNDILIAESARRIGGLVVTKNEKDFKRIKEFVDFRLYYQ
jgi:predicted nucleic acid-binding protein